jgi:hypothetical protein
VSWAADSCSYRSCRSPPSDRPDLSIESIETSSFIGYHYPPVTQISILSPPSRVYLFPIFETVFTIDGEVFTLNQRLILPLREPPHLTGGGSPRLHHDPSARKKIGRHGPHKSPIWQEEQEPKARMRWRRRRRRQRQRHAQPSVASASGKHPHDSRGGG